MQCNCILSDTIEYLSGSLFYFSLQLNETSCLCAGVFISKRKTISTEWIWVVFKLSILSNWGNSIQSAELFLYTSSGSFLSLLERSSCKIELEIVHLPLEFINFTFYIIIVFRANLWDNVHISIEQLNNFDWIGNLHWQKPRTSVSLGVDQLMPEASEIWVSWIQIALKINKTLPHVCSVQLLVEYCVIEFTFLWCVKGI